MTKLRNTKLQITHRVIFQAVTALIISSLVILSGCNDDDENVVDEASITSIDCSGVTFDLTIDGPDISGTATVPYSGGNGVAYDTAMVISSTGVIGYTATLESGTLASGEGNLVFDITGTSTNQMGGGIAFFSVAFGGQACVLEMTLDGGFDGGMEPGAGGPGGDMGDIVDNGFSDVEAVEVTACSSASGIEKIICLAESFIALLDDEELAIVQLDYSVENAQKWSNLPEGMAGIRLGLSLGEMDSTQVAYVKALLKEVTGSKANEGWDELYQHLIADNYLGDNGGGNTYGSHNYYFALLGTPSTSGTFEIQFGGHHFALANTYIDGELVGATPSFRGIEPFGTFTYNGESYQTMNDEQAAMVAMLAGLSSDELATAQLSGTFGDLVAGPQNDNNFPATPSGLNVGGLTSAQKELVLAVIETYVADLSDTEAEKIMDKYESEIDDTYIGYSGTTSVTERNDYVRIDGPSVWIEYSTQSGVILSGTHPHSVWRDKTFDYGGN
ncbi:DUF3500 domain-containing protein [Limibacter armeniacum]|uniref:DUF3500 domain-containing protein n=1 Tax=Limibacter armeniacum TaxID=466084 RepID=UPI002FE64E4D